MAQLQEIEDQSIDMVRNNAALHHLLLGVQGMGADKAVKEAHRVLREGGLFYLSVKFGRDGNIRRGGDGRWYQLYSQSTVEKLLQRNGFKILGEVDVKENPVTGELWLYVYAEKPIRSHQKQIPLSL